MSPCDDVADAVLVGAGAAGLAAALVLGRARRRVLLVDRGAPANLAATGIGGLLGHDRTPPRAFYDTCREQLVRYPTVATITGSVVAVRAGEHVPEVILGNGVRLRAHQVVLATGMRYHRPPIDGLQRYWGTCAFHCPFGLGPGHLDAITVAVVHDAATAELAVLMTNWTGDVTAVVAPGSLCEDERRRLRAARVHVESGNVAAVHGSNDTLTSVELTDGRRLRAQALLVPAVPVGTDDLAERIGAALTTTGHIAVDPVGRTSVDRIWAIGDRTDPRGNLARAIAAGSDAAIAIVRELTLGRDPGRAHPRP